MEQKVTIEQIINLCKNRGFIFAGSEIYGGLGNTWDYGPLGVELLKNIKNAWWKSFVQQSVNSYGIDTGIMLNPKVWEASGHLKSFSDPLMDCKVCKTRHRADNLANEYNAKHHIEMSVDSLTQSELEQYIISKQIACPVCGSRDFTNIRNFNLMFQTSRGVTNDSQSIIYLRPETAQGQYINFLNVQRSTRAKIPFGIAQIGKAFRNEITPGNFVFRTIEFEQMEHQWFCRNGTDEKFYDEYKQKSMDYFKSLGINAEHLRFKDHEKLAFYAKNACDIEFLFPFGWGEINGNHNRTNYDLTKHQEYSGKNMEYLDPVTNEKFIPYVIESSFGVGRIALALLCDAYTSEHLEDGTTREILKFSFEMAPYKIAVLPLIKKTHSDKANEVYKFLSDYYMCDYDDTASIGKRYRRQDEIGTPFCVTIDEQTMEDDTVTLRDRDTMKQIRLNFNEIPSYIFKL